MTLPFREPRAKGAAAVKQNVGYPDAMRPIVTTGEVVHYVPAIGDPACIPCTVTEPDTPPFIHISMTVNATGQHVLHASCDCRTGYWGYEPARWGYLGGTWHPASRCKMDQS